MPSLYLIDAHAYLHRAYHALPPLTTSRGEPVNAIYGFVRMLAKIQRQYKPDYIAACFDTAAPTFRHEAYAQYKATRKETDPDLVSQFPLAREAVEALNIARFELDGFEADDIIATLARAGEKKGWDVVVVTGDKDALQLVNERIRVLNESKDILFDAEKVREAWGVFPVQIPEIFALMGDSSDNVPGVSGIGEKTAVKLIQQYGDLENLLRQASEIKGKTGQLLTEHAQDARQSRALVLLDHPVPLSIDWDACRQRVPDAARLTPFLQKLEFHALIKDLAPALTAPIDTSSRDYLTLLTEAELTAWTQKALKAGRVCVDVETTSIDPLSAELVGISLSIAPGSAAYIPLKHQTLGDPAQLPLTTVRKQLQPLLSNEAMRIYGHNLKYDAQVLKRHGLPIRRLYCDTMVASYVLNPSRNAHGLKDLTLELLGEAMTSIDQLIGKGAKQITMDQVPVEKAAPYACADADMTLRLAEKLEPRIRELGLDALFYEMEMPLVPILAQMEETGIRIDRPYLERFGKDLHQRLQALEKRIHELAGETFNINSPKQLAVILFERLQLPVIRRTKTGISTDEEVLLKLADKHPLPKSLLEYRELQKLHSTYVEALLAAAGAEDRIHTSFNQAVAATGRLSSSDPNLQNIPIRTDTGRQIRKAFVPKSGCVLLSADYSQIDLRMLAHISKDPSLCEAFRKGEDVHATTASEIFGVALQAVTPEMRRVAKSINFGIVYGMSAFGLAQQLQIPNEIAKAHIERYFARYAGVRQWIDSLLAQVRRDGSVRTLLGRIRYLPDINSTNGAVRGFSERVAMNTPIQGTSADVIKVAMIHLAKAAGEGRWTGEMLLQVHDELVFEIPNDALADSAPVIRLLMEGAVQLDIPVMVDLKSGANWAEMTPLRVARV